MKHLKLPNARLLLILMQFSLLSCSKEEMESKKISANTNTKIENLEELREAFFSINNLSKDSVLYDKNAGIFTDKNTGIQEDIATLKHLLELKKVDRETAEIKKGMKILIDRK